MNSIIKKASQYVQELFEQKLSTAYTYHNFEHTNRVLHATTLLAESEQCADKDIELLQLAALFHDTGFIVQAENHEDYSVNIARVYLQENNFNPDEVKKVEGLILATKFGAAPQSKLEKIIQDADLSHLAADNYKKISDDIKKEKSNLLGKKIPRSEWLEENINFLKQVNLNTSTARDKWQKKIAYNINLLEQDLNKRKKKNADEAKKLGRGVETLFRVQLRNHISLSAIADTKANILLSVNAIIISVALSNLVPKLDNPSNSFLVIPTLILTLSSVASVILSVLSTRPKISNVDVTRDMIRNKQTNILFFGNFYKMSLEDFEWGIDYLINNEETLYNSLSKDLYYLGLVLERKYRLLRITYNVFMVGIILSAIAFIASFMLAVYTY